jgi:hypothetical protein
MSMMYPNGRPTPASQFMTGSLPNYGQGLVNFNQIPQALQQALQQQQKQQQQQPQPQNGQPMQLTPGQGQATTPGQNGGGFNPASFAAGLRKFFQSGGQGTVPAF